MIKEVNKNVKKLSRIDVKLNEYRVVCLVDAEDEDELREEECGCPVVDDTRLVALHGSQAEEEDGGEEEEAQCHSHSAPCQDFDWKNLSVLTQMSCLGKEEKFELEKRDDMCHLIKRLNVRLSLTSLLEMSMSTAKLVM